MGARKKGALDLEAACALLADGLPRRARWLIHKTPMDFDFSLARQPLRPFDPEILDLEPEDPRWSDLLIFGEYDYAEGGGARPYMGVRQSDGAVYGLDGEREEPLFALNSTPAQYVATFQYLNRFLATGAPLPGDAGQVLRKLDPKTWPASDWSSLVAYVSQPS